MWYLSPLALRSSDSKFNSESAKLQARLDSVSGSVFELHQSVNHQAYLPVLRSSGHNPPQVLALQESSMDKTPNATSGYIETHPS